MKKKQLCTCGHVLEAHDEYSRNRGACWATSGGERCQCRSYEAGDSAKQKPQHKKGLALPWERSELGQGIVVDAKGETVFVLPADARADMDEEFILRACNMHDELVAALERLAKDWDDAAARREARALVERAKRRRGQAGARRIDGGAP